MHRYLAVGVGLLLAACAGNPRGGKPGRAAAPTAVPSSSYTVFEDPEGARTPGKGSRATIGFDPGGPGWPPGLSASEADLIGVLRLMHQTAHAVRGQKGEVAVDVREEEAAAEAKTAQVLAEFREKRAPLPVAASRPAPPALQPAPGWAPPDYAAEIGAARRGARHGALAHCVDTWRRADPHRRKVFEELAVRPPDPEARVVLLEVAAFPEALYGYLLVAGGERIAGLLEGKARRVPAPDVHALGGVALGAVLQSDETAADRVTDGACYFLTVREGVRQVRFGWFAPTFPRNPPDVESGLLGRLAPLVESAWAGPELR